MLAPASIGGHSLGYSESAVDVAGTLSSFCSDVGATIVAAMAKKSRLTRSLSFPRRRESSESGAAPIAVRHRSVDSNGDVSQHVVWIPACAGMTGPRLPTVKQRHKNHEFLNPRIGPKTPIPSSLGRASSQA